MVLFLPFPSSAYERIVSLKPNLTEILFALGVGDKIVGVTSFCDYPPEAKTIDKVADYIQPDLEKVLSKRPDLILTSQENSSRREIEFLMKKGFKVLTFESETLDQLKKTILDLGHELGREDQAHALVEQMDTKLSQLKSKASQVTAPRVLFVVGHQPLVVAARQNLFDDVAPYLGVLNAAGENRFRYPTYSLEMFLGKAPEMILDFSMGSEAGAMHREERMKWWEQFTKLPAIQNKKVFLLDIGMIRATPRLPGELEKLFELIHQKSSS